MLEVREINFSYTPGSPVLRNLSLKVNRGEVLAVLGANGSGKSTLLNLMAGTARPQSGRVLIGQTDLERLSRRSLAKRIAVVPQSELGESLFTVREIVMLGRYPWQGYLARESEEDKAAVDTAMSATGLSALADRRVNSLSGGERQRVQVALALAQKTPVLLLDEPTTYLDIKRQIELLDLIAAGDRGGRTVIMIMHDLNLAAAYADRLALLADGGILALGTPGEVLTARNLAEAFGITVDVMHGANGRPNVVLHAMKRCVAADGPLIHLVGGGGTAANLIPELASGGYRVSLGVINQGDLDAAVADEWGVETVLDPPASPVSAAAAERCLGMMLAAEAVVVANVPFGRGNLDNLRLVLRVCGLGHKVLVINEDAIGVRDFAGGEAAAIMGSLLAAGACEIKHWQMAAEVLPDMLQRPTSMTPRSPSAMISVPNGAE